MTNVESLAYQVSETNNETVDYLKPSTSQEPTTDSISTLSAAGLDQSIISNSSSASLIRKNGLSATLTLINFLKSMIGPGSLTLGVAFKQAGLWTAFSLMFFIGFLSTHCMHQLVECSQYLSKKNFDKPIKYGVVGYEVMAQGPISLRKYKGLIRLLIDISIIVLQMGICCVQYIFIGSHLKEVFDDNTSFKVSMLTWLLLIFVPMVLINWTRSLRAIAFLSSIGNVLMFSTFVIIFYYLFQSPHVTMQLPWITDFHGVTTACGTILYSFEGQALVLPMENKLKHPQDMISNFGVLSTGMALTTIIDVSMGFFSYVKFGEQIRGSVTLNLPDNVLFIAIKLIFTLTAFFNFVIQQYVIVDRLWPILKQWLKSLQHGKKRIFGLELLFRTFLVSIAVGISFAVPQLEKIIPLVGFSAGTTISFIFPPLLHSILFIPLIKKGERKGSILRMVATNVFIVSIGLYGMIFGLYASFRNL